MEAGSDDDGDMFADICVDDLDEAAAEPEVDAAEPGEENTACAPAAAAGEPAGRPPRPPLHPGKPTAAAQKAAPGLAPAADGGGRQDSCSFESMASGDQEEGQQGEEVQGEVPAASADGDSASLSGEPSVLEPVASPAAAAVRAGKQAAADSEAAMDIDGTAMAENCGVGSAAAAAAAATDADRDVQEEDAEPVDLAGRAEQQTEAQLAAQPQELAMPRSMPTEAPASGEHNPSAATAVALQPVARKVLAPQPVAPTVPRPSVLHSVLQPKQVLAAKPPAPAVSKPAPGASAALAAMVAAPKAAAPSPVLKPTAAPAPSLANFSLPGTSSSISSLNLPLAKTSGLQVVSSAAGLKDSTSRLGPQLPAGTGTKNASRPAGPRMQKVPAPALGPALPTMQKQKALPVPGLHPPVQAALQHRQAPRAGQRGTPLSALPKHMQAAPAAHKAATPAPYTPAGDASAPAAARPAPPQAQGQQAGASAAAALSPSIPAPAQLADDILAADLRSPRVLEGHEAAMQESLALCAPIGEAVQEQVLVLEQLALEAEALRRQVNSLRVDLTIYRSSLAFMDSPMQAHSFEAARCKAAELAAGLASYQPPTFKMPPPQEELPPPLPLPLSPTEPQQEQELEEGGAGGQEADVHILPSTEPAEAEESPPGEASATHDAKANEEESLIKPRALEAAFDQQPLTADRAALAAAELAPAEGSEGEGAAAGAGIVPMEEEPPAPADAASDEAAAGAGVAPMEAEGQAVSVLLSEAADGAVVLSLALGVA